MLQSRVKNPELKIEPWGCIQLDRVYESTTEVMTEFETKSGSIFKNGFKVYDT